jgi:predicted Zn-dependent protease
MTPGEDLFELLQHLGDSGFPTAEVYAKRGSSKRFEIGPQGRIAGSFREKGWSVRAGDARASFFASSTGRPRPGPGWPAPDGQPVELPEPRTVSGWRDPADLDAPLLVESEAFAFLEGLERQLAAEVEGARLLRAVLEEGTSEAELVNSHNLEASFRSRAASLYLDAALAEGGESVSLHLAEREVRRFNPLALARLLANRLHLTRGGSSPERDRGEILLAPAVGIHLLASLRPLFLGPKGAERAEGLRDRRGCVGASCLTVVDDGRLPGGVLQAPVDGEGFPTRAVVLVEEGRYRQPLLSWRQDRSSPSRASGCARRMSWRDAPRPGFSHLYIQPDPAVSAVSLLGAVARGYYLVDAAGSGHVDIDEDRFNLPVCGFALRKGRPAGQIASAVLCGSVSGFLQGIQAVARDLTFRPRGAMVGSPTLLLSGLELTG